jgi:hypothetical protein
LRQLPKEADEKVEAVRAKIQIADQIHEAKVAEGTESVVFDLQLPAGKTKLTTWLFDAKGKAGGAYFTEVELLFN